MLESLKIDKKLLKNLDKSIIVITFLISIIGIISIFSANQSVNSTSISYSDAIKQIAWIAVSVIICYFVLSVDYSYIANLSYAIYWLGIISQVYALFCKKVNGANNWAKIGPFGFEPGEFIRIGLILVIAKELQDMDGEINKPKNFIILTIYSVIPMLLLLKASDMGLTIICFFIVFGMFFVAKLNLKVIAAGMAALVVLGVAAWNLGFIKGYQKTRIESFLNPNTKVNQIKYAYQANSAQIAIGSGGDLGTGFLKGTQSKAVPENQTDFVFCVLGEEWGFFGTGILLLLYLVLLIRFFAISRKSRDLMGSLICVGIMSSFLFSIYENIGMNIHLMPVTGITLPLVSYGGSSIVSNYITVALILNIGMRSKKINF